MKKPTITEVRQIAEHLEARAAIVVAFDGSRYAVVSYGMTKAECREVARTVDAIADGLKAGTIPAPRLNAK